MHSFSCDYLTGVHGTPRKDTKAGQGITSTLLIALMLFSLVPAMANQLLRMILTRCKHLCIHLSKRSTVNPGETAEYTVRVYNNGANPVSVNLAATNEQDCNGYSSAVGQIGQPIEAGTMVKHSSM